MKAGLALGHFFIRGLEHISVKVIEEAVYGLDDVTALSHVGYEGKICWPGIKLDEANSTWAPVLAGVESLALTEGDKFGGGWICEFDCLDKFGLSAVLYHARFHMLHTELVRYA